MPYAHKTKVPTDQSRLEIERICRKYGCTAFASGWQEDSASVSFAVKDRRVVFKLGLPKRDEREIRRRWRCFLCTEVSDFLARSATPARTAAKETTR